jgi:hypothetical protein
VKTLILFVLALTASGTAVVVLAPKQKGFALSTSQVMRLRGTDVYYAEQEIQGRVGPIHVQLAGREPSQVLVLGLTYTFRAGAETSDAGALAKRNTPKLVDALNVRLGDLSIDDVELPRDRQRLKRELRGLIERKLFPDGEARVERIYFDTLLVQATG